MGGGVSTVLPEEKKEKLSPASLLKFYQFEKVCFQDAASSPAELHIKLTAKFEELIAEDEAERERSKQENLERQREEREKGRETPKNFDNTKMKIVQPYSVNRAPLGIVTLDRSGRRHTVDGTPRRHKNSSTPVARKDDSPTQQSNQTQHRTTRTSSRTAGREMSVRDQTWISNLFLSKDTWTKPMPILESDYKCLLCNECFYDKDLLEEHVQLSKSHLQRAEENERKFHQAYKEAEKVSNIVRNSVDKFKALLDQTNRYEKDGSTLTFNQFRWKRAIRKVISKQISKKFEIIVEDLKIMHYSSKDVR